MAVNQRVAQHVLDQNASLGEALGTSDLDVIRGHDLQHGARGTGSGSARGNRDGHGRQRQVDDMSEEAAAVAGNRKEPEREPEQKHEQKAHPERRHREADHPADPNRMVDRAAVAGSGEDGERHREQDRDQRAVGEEEKRGPEALKDDGRDRRLLDDRGAKIALQRVPDETRELDRHRLIEAEARARPRSRLRLRARAA